MSLSVVLRLQFRLVIRRHHRQQEPLVYVYNTEVQETAVGKVDAAEEDQNTAPEEGCNVLSTFHSIISSTSVRYLTVSLMH